MKRQINQVQYLLARLLNHSNVALVALVCGVSMVMTPVAVGHAPTSQEMWRDASEMPYRTQEIYPTIYRQHIVVAGGLSPDVDDNPIGVSERVVLFSIKDNQWREGPSLPEPRHHPMLVVVDERLLAFGGFVKDTQGMWHNSTDVLELVVEDTAEDPLQTGRWQIIAQMPTPLAETLSAVHNGKVHLVSGRSPNSANNSQWNDHMDVATHLQFDPVSLTWSTSPTIPTARNSACAVTVGNALYTIGGRTVGGGNLATHEAYDFSTERWQTLAPLPQAQGGLACAAIGQYIYVFGGEYFDNGGGVYKEVWEYNIAANHWQAISAMPQPRHGLGALAVGDQIYVVGGALQAGGNQTSNVMSVFRPSAEVH